MGGGAQRRHGGTTLCGAIYRNLSVRGAGTGMSAATWATCTWAAAGLAAGTATISRGGQMGCFLRGGDVGLSGGLNASDADGLQTGGCQWGGGLGGPTWARTSGLLMGAS